MPNGMKTMEDLRKEALIKKLNDANYENYVRENLIRFVHNFWKDILDPDPRNRYATIDVIYAWIIEGKH